MGFTWNETIVPKVTKAKKIHIDSSSSGAFAKNVNQGIKDLLDNTSKCDNYDGYRPKTIVVPNADAIKYNDGSSIYDLADSWQRLATFCATALNPKYNTVQSAPHAPISHASHYNPHNPADYATANDVNETAKNNNVYNDK